MLEGKREEIFRASHCAMGLLHKGGLKLCNEVLCVKQQQILERQMEGTGILICLKAGYSVFLGGVGWGGEAKARWVLAEY